MKECYYYLDSTPTHSYMKALYKYPQNEYPYSWLVDENRRRSRQEPEFELCDTGEKILFIVPEKLPIKLTSSQFRVHPLLHLCEDSSLASIKTVCFCIHVWFERFPSDFLINIHLKVFEILLEPQLQCTSILHQDCD